MAWKGNARSGKFNAKRTHAEGISFASKKEAERYQTLRLLEKAGEIQRLRRQVRYDLYVVNWSVRERLKAAARRIAGKNTSLSRVKIGSYIADFVYDLKTLSASENDHFRQVVEDVKGFKTPLYKWKKKHVEAQYGIQIQEV